MCAGHFRELLKNHPVQTDNREVVVGYVCGIHNIVNKNLGKPHFNCENAFKAWGGECGCAVEKEKALQKVKETASTIKRELPTAEVKNTETNPQQQTLTATTSAPARVEAVTVTNAQETGKAITETSK